MGFNGVEGTPPPSYSPLPPAIQEGEGVQQEQVTTEGRLGPEISDQEAQQGPSVRQATQLLVGSEPHTLTPTGTGTELPNHLIPSSPKPGDAPSIQDHRVGSNPVDPTVSFSLKDQAAIKQFKRVAETLTTSLGEVKESQARIDLQKDHPSYKQQVTQNFQLVEAIQQHRTYSQTIGFQITNLERELPQAKKIFQKIASSPKGAKKGKEAAAKAQVKENPYARLHALNQSLFKARSSFAGNSSEGTKQLMDKTKALQQDCFAEVMTNLQPDANKLARFPRSHDFDAELKKNPKTLKAHLEQLHEAKGKADQMIAELESVRDTFAPPKSLATQQEQTEAKVRHEVQTQATVLSNIYTNEVGNPEAKSQLVTDFAQKMLEKGKWPPKSRVVADPFRTAVIKKMVELAVAQNPENVKPLTSGTSIAQKVLKTTEESFTGGSKAVYRVQYTTQAGATVTLGVFKPSGHAEGDVARAEVDRGFPADRAPLRQKIASELGSHYSMDSEVMEMDVNGTKEPGTFVEWVDSLGNFEGYREIARTLRHDLASEKSLDTLLVPAEKRNLTYEQQLAVEGSIPTTIQHPAPPPGETAIAVSSTEDIQLQNLIDPSYTRAAFDQAISVGETDPNASNFMLVKSDRADPRYPFGIRAIDVDRGMAQSRFGEFPQTELFNYPGMFDKVTKDDFPGLDSNKVEVHLKRLEREGLKLEETEKDYLRVQACLVEAAKTCGKTRHDMAAIFQEGPATDLPKTFSPSAWNLSPSAQDDLKVLTRDALHDELDVEMEGSLMVGTQLHAAYALSKKKALDTARTQNISLDSPEFSSLWKQNLVTLLVDNSSDWHGNFKPKSKTFFKV